MLFESDERRASRMAGPPPKTLRTCRDHNRVGVQGDGAGGRQSSAIQCCTGGKRDGGERQNASVQGRAGSQSRRTAHLPEDVVSRGAASKNNIAITAGDEGRSYLEDPNRVWIAVAVEGDSPGYRQ